MERKKIAIVGTGLIGGSLALQLNEKGLAAGIIGVDKNEENAATALKLGLVDEIMNLEDAIDQCDLIILATPVDQLLNLLPAVLNEINNQVVMDVGSTKFLLAKKVKAHPHRKRFVATHPMWGTEYSGPQAAVKGAFENRAVVICDANDSDAEAVSCIKSMYEKIGMHIVEMNSYDHDIHTAYISHISHITSFALANTVLEKEKEEDAIFQLASSGFATTVRLAKSNPHMWVPIFKQNRENVLDVLNEHISQLRKFKSCLEKENYEYLQELIENANRIRRIIK
ncbi:MAG: prephenate dehydrogenase [Chitinophagaceae bacterium]